MDYGLTPANELAELCANASNETAWREFVRRFHRPIALVVLRTARGWGEPSTAQVDDLVQETFLRLCSDDCRLLRSFVSRQPDSILGYLKTIAAAVSHDYYRSQASLKRGGNLQRIETDTDETEGLPNPQNRTASVELELQIAEIDRKMRRLPTEVLSQRDHAIFWLYYREGFSAREIGELPAIGLTVKGVESSIHRTTLLVRDAIQSSDFVSGKGFPELLRYERRG